MTYIIEDGLKVRDIGAEKFTDRWLSGSKNPYSMRDNVLFNDKDYNIEHCLSSGHEFAIHWVDAF